MRSVERRRFGRLAMVAGVVAIALTATVATALGRGTAGGPVTNYLTYVGGTKGKADPKLSPIVIGAINTQGGQVLVGPNWTKGAELAVKYVNTYLGGVQGHKLVLSECFTTSAEEDGTKCGQKFANDKRISVVVFGAVAVGNQSFYAALGGKKPVVSGVALLPVDATQKNGFALFGTNDSVLGPWGTFAKTKLNAKTAAVIYPQVPGIDVGAKVEKTSLEDAGITTKLVGFDPNSTDLTGPLTAAGAQTADIVVPQSNAAGCVNVAKTLQTLGVSGSKIVSNPLCLSGEVAAGLGGDLAPWVYGIASTLAGDKTDKAAVPYNKAMAQLKADEARPGRLGDRLLGPDPHDREDAEPGRRRQPDGREVHDGDQGRSRARRRSAHRACSCGKYKTEPAACNDQAQFFQYEGKGVFTRLSGWLRPPPTSRPRAREAS